MPYQKAAPLKMRALPDHCPPPTETTDPVCGQAPGPGKRCRAKSGTPASKQRLRAKQPPTPPTILPARPGSSSTGIAGLHCFETSSSDRPL